MRAPRIAIVAEGERHIHAGDGVGVYATLCGLDGDENLMEPARSWEKIDCEQCADAWKAWRAYTAADFEFKLRVRKSLSL